jgi:thiol-disulfide isomerase/thioredoxin
MKRISALLIITLLISGCTSSTKVNSPGFVAPCDQIKLAESAEKSVALPCLDGVGEINFYQLKGPIVINVWGSWCEGCKQEMPYFVELYQNPVFKSGEIQMLGVNVEEKSRQAAVGYIQKSGMKIQVARQNLYLGQESQSPGLLIKKVRMLEQRLVRMQISSSYLTR